jgi:hypothetical protein
MFAVPVWWIVVPAVAVAATLIPLPLVLPESFTFVYVAMIAP